MASLVPALAGHVELELERAPASRRVPVSKSQQVRPAPSSAWISPTKMPCIRPRAPSGASASRGLKPFSRRRVATNALRGSKITSSMVMRTNRSSRGAHRPASASSSNPYLRQRGSVQLAPAYPFFLAALGGFGSLRSTIGASRTRWRTAPPHPISSPPSAASGAPLHNRCFAHPGGALRHRTRSSSPPSAASGRSAPQSVLRAPGGALRHRENVRCQDTRG